MKGRLRWPSVCQSSARWLNSWKIQGISNWLYIIHYIHKHREGFGLLIQAYYRVRRYANDMSQNWSLFYHALLSGERYAKILASLDLPPTLERHSIGAHILLIKSIAWLIDLCNLTCVKKNQERALPMKKNNFLVADTDRYSFLINISDTNPHKIAPARRPKAGSVDRRPFCGQQKVNLHYTISWNVKCSATLNEPRSQ